MRLLIVPLGRANRSGDLLHKPSSASVRLVIIALGRADRSGDLLQAHGRALVLAVVESAAGVLEELQADGALRAVDVVPRVVRRRGPRQHAGARQERPERVAARGGVDAAVAVVAAGELDDGEVAAGRAVGLRVAPLQQKPGA